MSSTPSITADEQHKREVARTRLPLMALSFSYFAMVTGSLSMIGALPAISAGLNVSHADVARLIAAFFIVYAIAAPLIQIRFGHLPRRTLILGGLTLAAVGAVLSAIAPNYQTMIAARLVTALGAAAIGPVASAIGASMVAPERQGRALATVFLGMTMGSVISTPLASWIAALVGWRGMFVSVGGVTLLAAVAVALQITDRSGGQRLSSSALIGVLRQPALASGIAVVLFAMAGLLSSYSLIVPVLRERFALSQDTATLALATFGIAGLFGNALARWLADHWSADRSLIAALGVIIAVFVALLMAPANIAFVFAVIVVWAVAFDVFMPAQQRRMVELAPTLRGLVLALNASALYLGMSLGSFVAGQLSTHFGLTSLPVASIAFTLAGLVVLLLSRAWHAAGSRSIRPAEAVACNA
jgi:predicted MFS family arabinose efflux permease